MSLLTDSIFSGASTRLHSRGERDGRRGIRKSKSHGGLLSPLVRLARDPIGALNTAVGTQQSVPATDALGPDPNHRQILYLRMKNAETYNEWKAAAIELDALEGNNPWKEEDESPEYDAALVAARLYELDDARVSCNVRSMLFQLRTSLTRDLGGIGGIRLYKHSHIGTKKLIEKYISSAENILAALLDVSAKQGNQCPFTPRQLVDQIKYTRASFGRSALLLSGGGTFGMNHIGVVKCLWDQRLLPRIMSGASAGSIVSAVLCSKTDEEIPGVMHDFCHGDLDVFEKFGESESIVSKITRMFQDGGFFDIQHLTRVMRGMLGDMTFQEAYNRTRRILNIPVSTSSHYELPRLLNYITAPNVVIWSAVCTSCSVPLVYKKASLLAKDPKTRTLLPWDPNPNATWIDGSVDNDLPMTRLAEMFNINHFIVSQVNPHVVPFLTKDEELVATEEPQFSATPTQAGWLSRGLNIARGEAVHRMQTLVEMGFMQNAVTKLSSILSQRYSGDINIFPQVNLADLPWVLSNPTPEYMAECMLAGQRATWPKLSRIQNHLSLELALDAAVQELEGRAMSSEREQALAHSLSRPASAGNDLSNAKRSKSSFKMTRFDLKTEPPSPVLRKSAPTSPHLSRASLKLAHFVPTPFQQAYANSSQKQSEPPEDKPARAPAFQIVSPSTNEEGSSDRDYFAEVDSDTTDVFSLPSPITSPITSPAASPTTHAPMSLPTSNRAPLLKSQSRFRTPSTPPAGIASTSTDRRTGVLLNLTMTAATPGVLGAPERRYKKLFHPRASAEPETRPGAQEQSRERDQREA
ncbi:acyl transferase/acyl hydrolase/lysophospholipase [Ampelomyces quisqualis]|uniref:Patatin-like phospholipase domain-containing protein n=1 Tax=Ampelomyces quisqualis TaxID=50730 RepID=A0A6A5QHB4_AMPQU|nr:acyl transferase/acyl hydrolase/lysophospholipase [Ampelomyces quisqualis]